MASFNALSQPYSTRRDILLASVATGADISRSLMFLLKQSLLDAETGGTMSASPRVAGTIRTVRNSCDGVTAGAINDGVDRWTTTFDASKLVAAADGVAHSWMVVEDATHQFCLSLRATGSTPIRLAVTPKTTPFSAGTLTSDPTSAAEWVLGSNRQSGLAASWSWIADTTTGGTNRANFVSGADGQWYFFMARGGTGTANTFVAHLKAVDAATGTVTWVGLTSCTGTGVARGSPRQAMLTSSDAFDCRLPNGSLISTGGLGPLPAYSGTTHITAYGADARTSAWSVYPLEAQALTPMNVFLGELLDLYAITAAPVGSPNPSNAACERIVLGDFVIPFSGAAPLL